MIGVKRIGRFCTCYDKISPGETMKSPDDMEYEMGQRVIRAVRRDGQVFPHTTSKSNYSVGEVFFGAVMLALCGLSVLMMVAFMVLIIVACCVGIAALV